MRALTLFTLLAIRQPVLIERIPAVPSLLLSRCVHRNKTDYYTTRKLPEGST